MGISDSGNSGDMANIDGERGGQMGAESDRGG